MGAGGLGGGEGAGKLQEEEEALRRWGEGDGKWRRGMGDGGRGG